MIPADDLTLYCAMADLSDREREIVWWAYWRDMPQATIAVELGMSAQNVSSTLIRARRKLERYLARAE